MERPTRTDPPEPSNLTRAQQLLFIGQQLHPEAPLYNMAFCFEIEGAIDERCFAEAFDQLIEECDALRTVVASRDGIPEQQVLDRLDFTLPVIDLSSEDDPAASLRRWTQSRCAQLLKLERCTFDAALLKLGASRHAWYLNHHHIVSDAWSFTVLFERLRLIYEGFRSGQGVPADPPPTYAAYRDFERDARRQRAGEVPGDVKGAKGDAHWNRHRQATADAPVFYGRRPPRILTRSQRLSHDLSDARCERLRALAQQPGIRTLTLDLSLFRLFATVTFAYLHRVGGGRRVTLGALAHNRVSHDFKASAGLFTELYPLAVELDDGESYRSLHEKVAAETDAFLRSARPGGSEAELNRGIHAVVNFIRADFDAFDGAPVRARWLHSGHVEPEHHLRIHVHDFAASGRFSLDFDFNRDVFDLELRREAIGHFLALFDAMLDDWQQPISGVDLLTEAGRRQALDAAGGGEIAGEVTAVVARFAHHVADTPGATALICGDRRWSYRELDAQAAAVGVNLEPGSIVGLCLPRSAEAVIAILGVLKAGAAYVPIDPAWPAERIELVIHDAGCSRVLTDVRRSLPVLSDEVSALLASADTPPSAPCPVPAGDDLAYLIYTSGSTGRPKGVMIEHRALAAYVDWARGHYNRGRKLAFPLFTQLTFDLTVTSIFVPLAAGGTVVVYPETGSEADLSVLEVFDDDRVDIVKLTPSHLALVQDRDLSSSRIGQLILGGEELTTPLARRIHQRFGGGVGIHNEYGPTEATVGCVVHTYDPDRDRDATVPIGRPIAGMRAYVLDSGRNVVPFGVAGELWVGGPGLARGYLRRRELTDARFVTHEALDGSRLYRTGDLARLRPDGVFEYLGRDDGQVKIRGARVELGEVEAALASHRSVVTCAAAVRRRTRLAARDELTFCQRCGLASDYPGVSFDSRGICNQCLGFEQYGDKARIYFKSMDQLATIFDRAQARGEGREPAYDCIALLSGGKDSTYMVCRLVDMGLRVLALTLDNGYISEQAKGNIRRVVEALGVDHVFSSTPAMDEIFVDSLQRHANVCHGCFKTIYTLALKLARDKGIRCIVTGLSRGQFFETRLTEDLFTELTVSSDQIDANVLEFRKAYHRVDDAVRRRLDVSMFDDDTIFDEVQFVDFYRYCDVGLDELLAYLDTRVPWIRPSDTGRSTNCLINDVGIYVHKHVRGFHNYALPYSWDVRMGHKTRSEALAELDDDIDVAQVQQILGEIGYPDDVSALESQSQLVAYYVSDREIPVAELRQHAAARLPAAMVPSLYLRLDTIPLTAHGKIDRDRLPEPEASRPAVDTAFVAARGDVERTLVGIWREVLGIDRVGTHDNFFDLGGDSIMALRIVARARRAGLPVTMAQRLDTLTVASLAEACRERAVATRVVGEVGLTPAQLWFFEHQPRPERFHHVVRVRVPSDLDPAHLARGLGILADHHDALRQRFVREDGVWRSLVDDAAVAPDLEVVAATVESRRPLEAKLVGDFDLTRPPLLRAALFEGADGTRELMLVAHHLIVDAVSWMVLLDDLSHVCRQLAAGESGTLPPTTTSLRQWTASLAELVTAGGSSERADWSAIVQAEVPALPVPPPTGAGDTDDASRDAMAPVAVPAALASHRVELSRQRTQALLTGAPEWRLGVGELLIAALARTLAEPTDGRAVRLSSKATGVSPTIRSST